MSGIEAIVLQTRAFGEADRVVSLLTAAQGRIDAVAKGARASRRRFGGALEPGTAMVAELRRGRGALPILTAAHEVRGPASVRDDLDRLMYLTYGCEVMARLAAPEQESAQLFRLLQVWIELLEGDGPVGVGHRLAFEAKALTFFGAAPALRRCGVCGRPLEGTVRFRPEEGGGVHASCGEGASVQASELALLDDLRRTPLAQVHTVALPDLEPWRLARWIEHLTAGALKSREMLAQLGL